MVRAVNLGYPRIGAHRELKRSVEAYWVGDLLEEELRETARALREEHWRLQQTVGLDHIPSNDFSFYDHVLDAAVMVGAVPERFAPAFGDDRSASQDAASIGLDTYFAMARGLQEREADAGAEGAHALEMTKWFDTNYHYLVPELHPDQSFRLASTGPVDAFEEAKALDVHTRPVLLGPVALLLLSRTPEGTPDPPALLGRMLPRLLPVYEDLLRRLAAAGATDVQIDEPFLALDLAPGTLDAHARSCEQLAGTASDALDLHLTTYFGGLHENLDTALGLPVASLHLDLVRAPEQLPAALDAAPDDLILSLGLIDGRNVWRADLDARLETAREAVRRLGADRVMVGPSCSLLHVPVDLEAEQILLAEPGDPAADWLAFARQKLDEIVALAHAAGQPDGAGRNARAEQAFEAARHARRSRAESARVHDEAVQRRVAGLTEADARRESPLARRRAVQQETLELPPLPTTTIGSFPQTDDVRKKRAAFEKGNLEREAYDSFLEGVIADTVRRQEEAGLDVLVHGESERTDMVEYFARRLGGFLITQNGWVQSYGTRCVRPPILFGDVARPNPMTVRWSSHAQSLTERPVKALLTGPVTMLQWSFARDDQPPEVTRRQIALCIRGEVADLEAAGLSIIQIDEPAFRESLPLRRGDWAAHLDEAVHAFRIASGGAAEATQIHTHMCYAVLDDIIDAIARLDADVISIEAARSKMALLRAFESVAYPGQIGPGVYDSHSPRVPSQSEIEDLIEKALTVVPADRLWINPDSGLKTRRWKEVEPALRHLVAAARHQRARLADAEPIDAAQSGEL